MKPKVLAYSKTHIFTLRVDEREIMTTVDLF